MRTTTFEGATSCTGSDAGSDRTRLLEGEVGHHVALHQPDQPVRAMERPVGVNETRSGVEIIQIYRGRVGEKCCGR